MATPTRFPGAPGAPTRAPAPVTASAPLPASVPPPMPQFTLEETRNATILTIGDWVITSTKRAILANAEIEAWEKELGLPLPEMTFGNNSLKLEHSSGTGLAFSAMEALRAVAVGEGWEERVGGGVLVSMAETWSKGRSATSVLSDVPLSTKPVRPHDWTFSSTYAGHTTGSGSFTPSTTAEIPLPLLARQDPVLDRILFYDDVSLFEDELHDHGDSTLHVRIRVMPHSFFILARLFVRVDNVLFRIFDVRVYHAFGSDSVVRECSGLEADYDEVKACLKKRDDLSPLTDPNFVYQTLGKLAATTTSPEVDAEGRPHEVPRHSSRTRGKPWPGLGRRVDVLNLSSEEAEVAAKGIEKLSL